LKLSPPKVLRGRADITVALRSASKGRMTKITRELRLRFAITSLVTSRPNIAWTAYRENSREDG
jgi:hypothetical protein